jgi:hypothetical protein
MLKQMLNASRKGWTKFVFAIFHLVFAIQFICAIIFTITSIVNNTAQTSAAILLLASWPVLMIEWAALRSAKPHRNHGNFNNNRGYNGYRK